MVSSTLAVGAEAVSRKSPGPPAASGSRSSAVGSLLARLRRSLGRSRWKPKLDRLLFDLLVGLGVVLLGTMGWVILQESPRDLESILAAEASRSIASENRYPTSSGLDEAQVEPAGLWPIDRSPGESAPEVVGTASAASLVESRGSALESGIDWRPASSEPARISPAPGLWKKSTSFRIRLFLTGQQEAGTLLELGSPPTSAEHFWLASPPRIVLDLDLRSSSAPTRPHLRSVAGWLKDVRLGWRQGRLRVVLDLERAASYQVAAVPAGLLLRLEERRVDSGGDP